MKFALKTKYRLTLLLIFTLLIQLVGPVAANYVYAEEGVSQEEEIVEEVVETPGDLEGTEDQEEMEDGETEADSIELEDPIEGEGSEELDGKDEEAKEADLPGELVDGEEEENNLDSVIFSNESDPVTFIDIKLEHVDSDGSTITGDFKADSHVKIRFQYTIEDFITVDTDKIYSFRIPEEIPIIADQDFPLKDGNRILANVSVKTDGSMTVQFLEEINNENFDEDREGWIEISSQFGSIDIGNGGDKIITFEVNGESKDVVVKFEEIEETQKVTLEKWGNYDTEKNEITWTVKVNPTTEPKGKTIENIVIKDTIEEGQTYVPNSARLNGTIIAPDPINSGKLSYTFDELQDGQNQSITFKTKADLSQFITQGETVRFNNTVTGTYGKENTPTNSPIASVKTTVNFIKKTGKEVVGEGKINWTIEVNNNNLELPAGVKIEDVIGSGLEFNNDLQVDGKDYNQYGTLATNNNEFTFTFNNAINKKHVITYSTNVIDEDAYNSNDKQTYINNATIDWTGKQNGGTSTGDIGVGVSTSVISKVGASYNPSTHEVTWKIVVNSNKIKITDPIVTDELPETLEYVSHTISGNEIWDFTNNNNNLTFKYTGEITDTYTITLVTKIKDEHKDYFGDNSTKNITNTAKLTGTGVKYSTSTGTQQIKSEVIKKSAMGYDYITRKASWKILVNQNKMPVTNAIVTDEIQGEFHKFVEDSLMIDGVQVDSSSYTVVGNTITINLGDITTEKTITFETQIPEEKVEEFFKQNGSKDLKNKATITGNGIKDGGVTSEATQPVKNTVVSKKGTYINGNDFIDWEVIINSNELALNDVELEDILQAGLILDTTTVKLNELTIKSDGKYDEDIEKNLTTEFDSSTNKVTFKIGDINKAYILRFRTDVDDEYSNETFKNTIKLKGSNGEQEGESGSIGVRFQTGDAGGSGTSTRGSLTVVKVDKENPDETTYLKGAKFELLKEDKTTVEATSDETDEDGTIVFNKLRMGKYYIRETQAPKGYILDDELKLVELKKGVDTKHIIYEFENEKIKGNIEFKKTDIIGNPLEDAEFTIYHMDDRDFNNPIETMFSNDEGLVRFEGIPYGNYVIKETKAPVGYEPSERILNVSISKNNETIDKIKDPIVNKKIDGDLEVLKLGEKGESLPGAIFELVQNGEVKYTSDETDKDGRYVFKKLKHGNYILREKKAPKGYSLSEQEYEVVIKQGMEEDELTQRFEFENTKIRGDIQFIKYGVDGKEKYPLEDVYFELYHEDGETPVDDIKENPVKSDKDGVVLFKGVPYGDYIIKEKETPKEYVPSLKDMKVSIENDEETVTPVEAIDGIENTKIRGSIKILKVDRSTDRPLRDAKIGIYNSDDELLEEKITDETGIVRFDNLEYGSYYFKEIEAPSGYVRNNDKHFFEIEENKVVINYTLENRRIPTDPGRPPTDPSTSEGRIKIIKKSTGSNELLQGAEFNILNSNNRIVDTLKTNSKGEAVSKYLPLGRYTIKEIDSPQGYVLDEETIEVRVSNGVTKEVIVYNAPIDPDKPVEPEDPKDPEEQEDPDNPVDPEDPLIDLDGDTPQGGTNVDGEDEDDLTIGLDGDTPQGGTKVDKPILPKTGEGSNIFFYFTGFILIAIGLFFRRRTI